jgi:branched-chain amino acid transport system permease protein
MGQVIINILYSAFVYLLLSISFSVEYYTTKFFNLFHAFIIGVSAYLLYFFAVQMEIHLAISIFFALIIATSLGIFSELLVFSPMRKRETKAFQVMIASLGLYIVFQNLISLVWGATPLSIRQNEIQVGMQFIGGYITYNQVRTIILSILLFAGLMLFFKFTQAGRYFRAVSANLPLSMVFGIKVQRVFLGSFLIGSLLASIAGILVAYETGLTPNMGFNLFLYGAVVLIIGGTGNLWGLLWASLLLASLQHFAAYYLGSKWLDAIAYFVLIAFLLWKPLGFSGQNLKKTEI